MKATGIVRRIDDLGRVVIPKEIRRTLRIREGDPLEIYTATDGEVIFKKYSPVGELSAFASQYAEVLSRVSGLPVIICDKDHVIAASGVSKENYLNDGFHLFLKIIWKAVKVILQHRQRSVIFNRLKVWNTERQSYTLLLPQAMLRVQL